MSLHLTCDEAIDPIIQVQLACTAIEVEGDNNQRA
jgi:acid stress-induced BolA-like protein IbaG/YrbA